MKQNYHEVYTVSLGEIGVLHWRATVLKLKDTAKTIPSSFWGNSSENSGFCNDRHVSVVREHKGFPVSPNVLAPAPGFLKMSRNSLPVHKTKYNPAVDLQQQYGFWRATYSSKAVSQITSSTNAK